MARLTTASGFPATVDAEPVDVPDTVALTAYFVVAESLANVLKHSGAEHADVGLLLDEGWLDVVVRDEGRGGAVPGRGLRALHDRVAAVRGTLRVDSPAGAGTTVRARLPVAVAAPS